MRDTFLLLWVGFLVVGVIGSIVSGIRKQAQRAQAQGLTPSASAAKAPARIPPQWQPPPAGMPDWVQRVVAQVAPPPKPPARPPPAPKPAAPPQPVVEHHEFASPRAESRGVARLFRDRKTIVQAVIAAEVLGKPLALRDE